MRKFTIWQLIVVLVFSLSLNTMGQELLLNNSFESWDDDTQPTGWTHVENVEKEADASNIHSGTYSAKHSGGNAKGSTKDLGQTIEGITPGDSYTISFWYKVVEDDGTDARIWCYWKNGSTSLDDNSDELRGPNGQYLDNNGGIWTQYSVTLNAPATADGFYFEVRTYGAAITYWDDMSLFQNSTSGVATPVITPPSGTYIDPVTVEMTCGTDGATIYYTTDGSDPDEGDTEYTNGFTVSTTTTVKARAYKSGLDASNIAVNEYTFTSVTEVSTIADLRAQDIGDTYYKLTGEAVLTFQQSYRSQKFIQDATAAIKIDDNDGNITTEYNLYDGITGITGQLSEYGDMLQFIPTEDPGSATSTGNTIVPQVVTLDDLSADFEDYEAELVKVEGAVFADAGGTFATGTVYPISDASKASYNFRTSFYSVDYIGETIPSGAQDLVLLPDSRTDGEYVVSRSAADMTPSSGGNPASQLSITSVNNGNAVYENQEFSVTVQSQDEDGVAANVDADTEITISLGTGTGTLGGTLTGTIADGSSTVTISGITYGPHENGVVLNANGGSLSQGVSAPFDVLEVVVADLVITEIMYNGMPGSGDTLEYIELYNNGSSTLNLENYSFTEGVTHTFSNVNINAGSYLLIAANASAIQDVFGVSAVEWTGGGLSNGGESIELRDASDMVVAYVDYGASDPWPAKETGKSIRFCNPELANNEAANWSISEEYVTTIDEQDIYGTPLADCGAASQLPEADFEADNTTIDEGNAVQFTDLSTNSPTSYLWTFEGGTPATSTEQNPSVTYANEGVYDVTLYVENTDGNDTEVKVDYITVNGATAIPVANFTADVTTIDEGDAVQFTDLSTNSPTSYLWTFEGGTPATSTEQNPSVTYANEGVYDVTLYVENTDGNDTEVKVDYITVNGATAIPVANFTADVTTIDEGDAVQFTDLSTNSPTSYLWTFEGGTPATSTEQNPSVTYAAEGVYDVTLYVENTDGNDTEVKTDYITVLGEPVDVDLVITEIMYNGMPGSGDTLEYIELYNNGSNSVDLENYYFTQGVEYVFGDVSIDAGAYLLIAANASAVQDVFGVSALEWTGGGLSNGGEDIEIKEPSGNVVVFVDYQTSSPWPAKETGKSIRFCDPDLDNNEAVNWSISEEYVTTIDEQDIYGTPMADCGAASQLPVADFEADNTSIDEGDAVQFTDLSTNSPTSYLWTFEGGTPATSTEQNPSVTYANEGVYDVTLYVENADGNDTEVKVDYIQVSVPVIAPVAEFTSDQTVIFVGQSIQFTDQSSNNPTDWTWTFEGGTPATSNAQNPTVTYNTAGTYDVTLLVENSAGSDELLVGDMITVLPATVGDLVITEIMYNPPEDGDDSLEYIEIYNNSTESLNLYEYEFSEGVDFVFPDMNIESGDYLVIAKNADAFYNTFGFTALQWTSGALSNGGELIKLINPTGVTIDSVPYQKVAPWPTNAAGDGPSITICDPNTENSVGENWHASVNYLADNEQGVAIYGSPAMAPAPVADFMADETSFAGTGQVEFTEMATCNAETFAWEFEGGTPATSTEANPTVTYSMAGDFDVTLTVSNATGSHTLTMADYIHIGVGLSEQTMNQITVIPNPSNGHFKLQNPDRMMMEVEVYNVLGKLISESETKDMVYDLDLISEENGIYFVRIIISKQIKTIKIIKQ